MKSSHAGGESSSSSQEAAGAVVGPPPELGMFERAEGNILRESSLQDAKMVALAGFVGSEINHMANPGGRAFSRIAHELSAGHSPKPAGLHIDAEVFAKGGSKAVKGLGALAAYGAYSAGVDAVREAKKGEFSNAVLSGTESVGATIVTVSSIVGVAGIARLAPLAKAATPIGALLGYVGAMKSANKGATLWREGLHDEAKQAWKGASIRAGGATAAFIAGGGIMIGSSAAAGMVAGASLGSVIPVVGTVVGAGAGIAIAYYADKWAEGVEAKKPVPPHPVAALSDINIKERIDKRRELSASTPHLESQLPAQKSTTARM